MMSGVFMFVGLFHFASWLLDAAPARPAPLCAASSRHANRGRPYSPQMENRKPIGACAITKMRWRGAALGNGPCRPYQKSPLVANVTSLV